VLDETRARAVQDATLGEILPVYRVEARKLGLRAGTITNTVSALERVLGCALAGRAVETYRASELTAAVVDRYVDRTLAADPSDRGRRSLRSTLRQARSLFARWTAEKYAGMALPDLGAFLRAGNIRAPAKVYEPPDPGLVEKTIAAGRALAGTDPALYAVFLLCYDLALRAGEASACKWNWFRVAGDGATCDVIRRLDWAPKGRERSIPVAAAVWAQLQALRRDGDEYVLPGESATARRDLVIRRMARWMRAIGWDRERYPKAAHELRKLQGSRWFTEIDPQTAQEWLGHTSIETTCRYYCRLTRQPAPLVPAGM